MKNSTKGITHFFKAFGYSIDGFKWVWQKEVAFRHDVLFGIITIAIVAFLTNFNITRIAFTLASVLILLITELLNSAVENVVDIVSPEYNILAKSAKDMCSAAVFIAVVLVIITSICSITIP